MAPSVRLSALDSYIAQPVNAGFQKNCRGVKFQTETLPPVDRLTFLETAEGKGRTANGLGGSMRAWCDAAGLPGCTSHGLRKACARRLAEAGATASEIASVTGHAGLEEVERYTRAASRSKLADAAMGKVIRIGEK